MTKTKLTVAFLSTVLVSGLGLAATGQEAPRGAAAAPPMAIAHVAGVSPESQTALVKKYCVVCHNDRAKPGNLTLAQFDVAEAHENAPVAEKMIRKLRAGMMPPPGVRRPDADTIKTFIASLEARMDEVFARQPNPGRRTFQRLNRAEYSRAVRDLLDIDVNVDAFLPPDTFSSGFDNIADVQSLSPTLLEGYLLAASQISRLAVGDPSATPSGSTYAVPRTEGQVRQVKGAPFGTRGGISVVHMFPADGDYVFTVTLFGGPSGELFGGTTISSTDKGEQLEISVNGEQVALFDLDPWMSELDPDGLGLRLRTPPIHVRAGPQRVSAAFFDRYAGPIDDLLAPIEFTNADPAIGIAYGVTALPHLRNLNITGPHNVTGVSDTPSRRKIFTCHPTTSEEGACATDIVKRLASQAYREPVGSADFEDLMRLYVQEHRKNGFESGIRLALQGILANPRFLFRLERTPSTTLDAGQIYRISDLDLASRLSFFLWGTLPDAELVAVATLGTLRNSVVLEKQVRRMLADSRSKALSTRFAGQWLRLQDVEKVTPEPALYPDYDRLLSKSYMRETELFFDNLVREDRNVLDLLTADYSFVNERIAKQYGIPNVIGNDFRRVRLPPERRGILGHGSILLQTSVADRTSPVIRGKWIMEVLLGMPPPPPPPDIPDLEEIEEASDGRRLTTRERLGQHRANPACSSCHDFIDPPGLALENFDVTGKWRIKDNGVPIDATGQLYDGTTMDGPAGLRDALLKYSDVVLLSFTENLLTYALGRRVEYYDMPTVRAIVRDAARNGNRMSSFIRGIVKSAAFQMSKTPAVTTEADARTSDARTVNVSRR